MERLDPPVRQGTDAKWTVTLEDSSGQPLTGVYTGIETLVLLVWPGSSRAALVLPYSSAAWLSASAGTITLTLDALDTASMAAGFYELAIDLVSSGSGRVEVARYAAEITASPGAGLAPPVYCTLDDCRKECPWILDAVIPDPNIPNNLEPQRGEARAWFDNLIQRHWRGGMSLGAEAGLLARRRSGQRNLWLQQQLDAGALMLTTAVTKANAYYALGLALRDLIGFRGKTTYQDLSADYFALAEHQASTTTTELDTNADGTPDFAIDLGFMDVLRG